MLELQRSFSSNTQCGVSRDAAHVMGPLAAHVERARGGPPRRALIDERSHPGVDVVADQAHPLDAVDAAFRRLVGVPVSHLGAVGGIDVGLSPEGDDEVDGAQ